MGARVDECALFQFFFGNLVVTAGRLNRIRYRTVLLEYNL